MFEFFSISLYIVPAAALILFLFFDQKLKALIYGSLIVFTTSLNNVLKNLYHQPRPYMLEDEILAYKSNLSKSRVLERVRQALRPRHGVLRYVFHDARNHVSRTLQPFPEVLYFGNS